jgi:hypothetical protein
MKKNEILKLIIPLVSCRMDDTDFVYEPINGGGLGICKQYFLYDKTVDMLLPLSYESIEVDESYDWDEYKKASLENIKDIEVKVSTFPKDDRISALTGECASALLFSDKINEYFKYERMLICPLYDDFIMFMKVNSIDDYLKFSSIVKTISANALNKRISVTADVFIFDPVSLSIKKIDKEQIYGNDFSVIIINNKSETLDEDIKHEAEKLLYSRMAKERNKEEALNLFMNPDFAGVKDKMVSEVEKEIREMIKSGKNIK